MPEQNILDDLTVKVFPLVVKACRTAVIPQLKSKGVKVVSQSGDFGTVVTQMDVGASGIFLQGIGLPGSFTEEQDSGERQGALNVYQNDPCDGTGDAIMSMKSEFLRRLSPTNLTSFLARKSIDKPFVPRGAIIYHVLGEFALVSDGDDLLIGKADAEGQFVRVDYRQKKSTYRGGVRLSMRLAYPQTNAHGRFPGFLINEGLSIESVPSGGAGYQALQLCRSVIELEDESEISVFTNIEPLDVIFNAQPDWKTWDVDPITVVARALGFYGPRSIFGSDLEVNARNATTKDMVHTLGCVFARTPELGLMFTGAAHLFRQRHPDLRLTEKNY